MQIFKYIFFLIRYTKIKSLGQYLVLVGLWENEHSHLLLVFFLIYFVILSIYLWLCWVFVAMLGLFSSCRKQRRLSSCRARASRCSGFSCGAQVLGRSGFSSCSSQTLEYRLNSHGTQALLLCGMWDLPRSGIEPVSHASAGRFFTEPPGKPPSTLDRSINRYSFPGGNFTIKILNVSYLVQRLTCKNLFYRHIQLACKNT